MKLSEMFASLSESTRDLENQMEEWDKSLSAKGADLVAKAKEWQATTERRTNEWAKQVKAYSENVDADMKGQWQKMQSDFDAQMANIRKQASDWRAEAERKDAKSTADWYEAYAANMVTLAKRADQEAAEAIAEAAVARGKAEEAK